MIVANHSLSAGLVSSGRVCLTQSSLVLFSPVDMDFDADMDVDVDVNAKIGSNNDVHVNIDVDSDVTVLGVTA